MKFTIGPVKRCPDDASQLMSCGEYEAEFWSVYRPDSEYPNLKEWVADCDSKATAEFFRDALESYEREREIGNYGWN